MFVHRPLKGPELHAVQVHALQSGFRTIGARSYSDSESWPLHAVMKSQDLYKYTTETTYFETGFVIYNTRTLSGISIESPACRSNAGRVALVAPEGHQVKAAYHSLGWPRSTLLVGSQSSPSKKEHYAEKTTLVHEL